ncbi:hypothetical protein D3C84_855250 [compost metagenome]
MLVDQLRLSTQRVRVLVYQIAQWNNHVINQVRATVLHYISQPHAARFLGELELIPRQGFTTNDHPHDLVVTNVETLVTTE